MTKREQKRVRVGGHYPGRLFLGLLRMKEKELNERGGYEGIYITSKERRKFLLISKLSENNCDREKVFKHFFKCVFLELKYFFLYLEINFVVCIM